MSVRTLLKDSKGRPIHYGDKLSIDLGNHPTLGGYIEGTLTRIKNGRLIIEEKTSIPITGIKNLEVINATSIDWES